MKHIMSPDEFDAAQRERLAASEKEARETAEEALDQVAELLEAGTLQGKIQFSKYTKPLVWKYFESALNKRGWRVITDASSRNTHTLFRLERIKQ